MAVAIPFVMMAMAAYGAVKQGNEAKAVGEYNAALGLQNAAIARDQAQADAASQERHSTRVIGAMRAGYGASGVTLEGSPLDVLESSAAEAELDRQNILYRGELRALGYNSGAELDRMRGSSGQQAGYFGAASSILMGGARAYHSRPSAAASASYSLGNYQDPGVAYGPMT
jgi:hypothetical protein